MTFSSPSSTLSADLSPTRLSYAAALRGVAPRKPDSPFAYARIGAFEAEDLLCLAASNPEGAFYGVVTDSARRTEAEALAASRNVANVVFCRSTENLPINLNYLCCDESPLVPSGQEQEHIFDLAAQKLAPGGIFSYAYKAFDKAENSLRFLIKEYAPELSVEEARVFLQEMTALGARFFETAPQAQTALEKAIATKTPDVFFESLGDTDSVSSGTFNVISGLLPRGFAFAGDSEIGMNYLQLAAPSAAHEILAKCAAHLLYEPIKDFVTQRPTRRDIWVRLPVEQTADKPTLFGFFTFGCTMPRDKIPATLSTTGAPVALTTPLFAKLLDLMTTLPLGIGDFLQHPAGKDFSPDDVVEAFQVLVAAGIAHPMRGRYEGKKTADLAWPVWASPYNASLTNAPLTNAQIRLASPVVGGCVTLPIREALVLQALNRAGLANAAGVLQPELKRLIEKNPGIAAQIMDSTEATDEAVGSILTATLQAGLTRWYAYGLLAA